MVQQISHSFVILALMALRSPVPPLQASSIILTVTPLGISVLSWSSMLSMYEQAISALNHEPISASNIAILSLRYKYKQRIEGLDIFSRVNGKCSSKFGLYNEQTMHFVSSCCALSFGTDKIEISNYPTYKPCLKWRKFHSCRNFILYDMKQLHLFQNVRSGKCH